MAELPFRRPLDVDTAASVQEFVDEGLVWLVNTAILHPRGWALAFVQDGTGAHTLHLVKFGEYTTFKPGEATARGAIARYEAAELARGRRMTRWPPKDAPRRGNEFSPLTEEHRDEIAGVLAYRWGCDGDDGGAYDTACSDIGIVLDALEARGYQVVPPGGQAWRDLTGERGRP